MFELWDVARNETGGANGLAVLISHKTSGKVVGFRPVCEALDRRLYAVTGEGIAPFAVKPLGHHSNGIRVSRQMPYFQSHDTSPPE
jgi:hypothetical protein